MMTLKKFWPLSSLLLCTALVWAQGRGPAVDPVQEIAADQEVGPLTTFVGHNFSALAPQDLRSPAVRQSERRYLQDQRDLSLVYLLALLAIVPAGVWYAVRSQMRFNKKQAGHDGQGGKVLALPTAGQKSKEDDQENKKAA
ncbi:MAG: hypothetical protein J6Y94_04980 [Bacteriovoracaceae bacterium]|nr:hypothetical protein [Bacteriovoracaceae bacterium]